VIMRGACWGDSVFELPLGTGSLDLSRVDVGSCGESRRCMRTACVSELEGTWVPEVHAVCPHNEIAALLKRVLAPMPSWCNEPMGSSSLSVFAGLKRIARAYSGERWSHLVTAQSYSGLLRRRYLEAERSLRFDGPVTSADARLDCFLKAEKLNVSAKFPKPRLIFPRSPRYNLDLASRLKPFEHWLWGYLTAQRFSKAVRGFSGVYTGTGRIVAKGLNPRQRANLILRKFKSLESCVCFEVDGKAFEAHVGRYQLEQESEVYASAFPGDGGLQRLLREQRTLAGKLPCGARFSREGGRASGDFNTGMGNTLIMLVVVVAVLRSYKVPFDLLADGDNAIVFLRQCDSSRVMGGFAKRALMTSGHELVLERGVVVPEEIVFGQSRPVFLGERRGWVMVRDFRKVVSGACSSHRWLSEPRFATEFLAGVGRCELSLARGLPVLQAWSLGLINSTGGFRDVRAHPHVDYFQVGAWLAEERDLLEVSAECRESFSRAFGVTPSEQILLESSYQKLPVAVSGWVEHFPIGQGWETRAPGLTERYRDAFL